MKREPNEIMVVQYKIQIMIRMNGDGGVSIIQVYNTLYAAFKYIIRLQNCTLCLSSFHSVHSTRTAHREFADPTIN